MCWFTVRHMYRIGQQAFSETHIDFLLSDHSCTSTLITHMSGIMNRCWARNRLLSHSRVILIEARFRMNTRAVSRFRMRLLRSGRGIIWTKKHRLVFTMCSSSAISAEMSVLSDAIVALIHTLPLDIIEMPNKTGGRSAVKHSLNASTRSSGTSGKRR